MKVITQDITFSIDMTTISTDGYKRIMDVTEALSDNGQVNTFTYNEDGNDDLDAEQKKHIDELYKED